MNSQQPSSAMEQPQQVERIPVWIGIVLEHQHQLERALITWSRGAFHREHTALS